jgi:flavin-dependent dehydrogenase
MSWSLARRGVRVLVIDRASFPREKVCGDYVEPRGLRLFQAMGCLGELEADGPLAVTHVNLFLEGRSAYRERIPFYAGQSELPQHGYIIPRSELDQRLLAAAASAGAEVREGTQALGVERQDGRMRVRVRSAARAMEDARYIAVSQRAYVAGLSTGRGEAAFCFDRDLFPGYGWLFPMSGGRANVGVGVLAETRDRYQISVPGLFSTFLDKLRRSHPDCGELRLASKPIGGIVKTYGGRGRNHFDGGILVGDAGCYVDPMTGEGITPAAESALLGAATIAAALEEGRTDAAFLAAYDRASRAYFDPSMSYLDFVACLMRNRHFSEFWLHVVARGCALAMRDQAFARVGGAAFGGMDVRPLETVSRIWAKGAGVLLASGAELASGVLSGRAHEVAGIADAARWHSAWWGSLAEDPAWHMRWLRDVTTKWLRLPTTMRLHDPRMQGPELQLHARAASGARAR